MDGRRGGDECEAELLGNGAEGWLVGGESVGRYWVDGLGKDEALSLPELCVSSIPDENSRIIFQGSVL